MSVDVTGESVGTQAIEARAVRQVVDRPPVQWHRVYPASLAVLDLLSVLLGGIAALQVRFGGALPAANHRTTYVVATFLMPVVWVALLTSTGSYRLGRIGLGADEYKSVFNAGLRLTAFVCAGGYVLQMPISRSYPAVALPVGVLLTLVFRYAARKTVHRLRLGGRCMHAVVAVGDPASTSSLSRQLHGDYTAGLTVVASYDVSSEADIDELLSLLADYGADTVAVTSSSAITPSLMRQLGWRLEGTGVTLLVAPALTNIAGPRISIRPVSGLPLLEVAEPDLTGGRQLVKATIDRLAAAVLLALLAPVMLAVAVVVRATSSGPALFKQRRLGRGGQPFTIYKFRTMYDGADDRFLELVERQAEKYKGGMFVKDPQDPRVTPVGRFLRRWSVDEFPQLINVLKGDMSLVGPRPLQLEVAQTGSDVRRRLLVKPGITGLWQVSGRSDLPYDEAVRVDLYYVENWSLSFDLMILWKTVFVALRGSGAY